MTLTLTSEDGAVFIPTHVEVFIRSVHDVYTEQQYSMYMAANTSAEVCPMTDVLFCLALVICLYVNTAIATASISRVHMWCKNREQSVVHSCYLMPSTPATPASYSKGTADGGSVT